MSAILPVSLAVKEKADATENAAEAPVGSTPNPNETFR